MDIGLCASDEIQLGLSAFKLRASRILCEAEIWSAVCTR